MALFDVADCEPLRIEQITAQGFLKPIVDGDEPFLCLAVEDAVYATILHGEWAYHSAPITTLSNRKGLFIPNIQIRVDMNSMALDDGNRVGAIVRSPGAYGVRTYREGQGQFTQQVIVPIDGVIPQIAPDAVRVAFTRWEIGRVIDDEWLKLWAVDVTPAQA